VKNPSPIAAEFLATGKCATCPVIDMHTHPDRYRSIYFPAAEPEKIIEIMDGAGVRFIVGAPHMAMADPVRGNAYMVSLIERWPDRFKGYWVVNPNYPEVLEEDLKTLDRRPGYIGFKFLPSYHGQTLAHPTYARALAYADERGLAALSHTWGGGPHNGPDEVRAIAERYANVRLLLGHSLHGDWDAAVRVARDFPNTYLELTAAASVGGVIEKFVGEVGAHRMLLGTDLPWFDPHWTIGAVVSAHITDDDRHEILHRAAEKLVASIEAG